MSLKKQLEKKNKDTMRILLKILVIFTLQFVIPTLIYNLLCIFYENNFGEIKHNLNWGITLHFAIYFYVIISFFSAIFNYVFGNRHFFINIILFGIFFIYYAQNITYTPFRTGLLLISAIIGFFTPLLLNKITFQNNMKCHQKINF